MRPRRKHHGCVRGELADTRWPGHGSALQAVEQAEAHRLGLRFNDLLTVGTQQLGRGDQQPLVDYVPTGSGQERLDSAFLM